MSEPVRFLSKSDWHPLGLETNPDRAGGLKSAPPTGRARREFVGFDQEQAVYDAALSDLISRANGQFVVVVRDEIAGPVGTFHEAMKLGYDQFGLGPLYIKQVQAEESASETTRDIDSCRP